MYVHNKTNYNQVLSGFFGQFGSGGNSQIFYLQTGVGYADLDKISLVSDIAGSEKWPVRDLFQREVDNDRVENGLLPYFKDKDKSKFFNPITLTFLPLSGDQIVGEIPSIEPKKEMIDNYNWIVYEFEGYFRFRYIEGSPGNSVVEWNDSKVKVVAIDGQHRLSALKRFKSELEAGVEDAQGFSTWTVPVVLFGLRKMEKDVPSGRLLDSIRNIFVYINETARKPNRIRSILLDSQSVNAVFTQELLEICHENDCKKIDERDVNKTPLIYFEWRGLEEDGKLKPIKSHIQNVEEIYRWFDEIIFGSDFKDRQKKKLGVGPTHSLNSIFSEEKLLSSQIEKLKKYAKSYFLMDFLRFLAGVSVNKKYIEFLRNLEVNGLKKNVDVYSHAWYKLRFGSTNCPSSIEDKVKDTLKGLESEIELERHKVFTHLLSKDIGWRAIIVCFTELKPIYDNLKGETVTFSDYVNWILPLINKAIKDGWFDDTKASFRVNITEDKAGGDIINYRINDVKNAFGPLLMAVCLKYSKFEFSEWKSIFENIRQTIEPVLQRQYKKQERARLKPQFPNGGKPLDTAAKRAAEDLVNIQLDDIENEIIK